MYKIQNGGGETAILNTIDTLLFDVSMFTRMKRNKLISVNLDESEPVICVGLKLSDTSFGCNGFTELNKVRGVTFDDVETTHSHLHFMKWVYRNFRHEIKGVIHNTGQGHHKVENFIEKVNVIKFLKKFEIPKIFKDLDKKYKKKGETHTPYKQMVKKFNLGYRMELYTGWDTSSEIICGAGLFNVDARRIGFIRTGTGKVIWDEF